MTEPHAHSGNRAETDDTDSWSLVDFVTPHDDMEIVSDALWMRGVVAIEERDATNSFVTLRTSMGDDPADLIAIITEQFPQVSSTVVYIPRSIADTWRTYATHTYVNDDIAIVPAWLPAPPNVQALFIEPLDTFGLGNHPTTVLAFRLALKHVRPSSNVFDLGSGSGVLAVGLAKFRSCHVRAFDIADSAREALALNASLNDVTTVEWHSGISGSTSQCVVANILAPVLIAESESISEAVDTNGYVILSGMRDEQVDGVVKHYQGCVEVDRESEDGWTAVVLQKTS